MAMHHGPKYKTCLKCKVAKIHSDYTINAKGNPGGVCLECKSWPRVITNTREYNKKQNLRKKYNLSVAEYEAMLVAQCGLCAVCGQEETRINNRTDEIQNLSVHHDHKTGLVIGLWCNACNIGAGSFRDDPSLMHRAARLMEEVLSNS